MVLMRSKAAFEREKAVRTCASAALLAAFAASGTAPPPSLLAARRGVLCKITAATHGTGGGEGTQSTSHYEREATTHSQTVRLSRTGCILAVATRHGVTRSYVHTADTVHAGRRTSNEWGGACDGPPAAVGLRSPLSAAGSGSGTSSVLSQRVMAGWACVTPTLAVTAGAAAAVASFRVVGGASSTACTASDFPLPDDAVLDRAGSAAFVSGLARPSGSICCAAAASAAAASAAARRRAAAAATAASWRRRQASRSASEGTDVALCCAPGDIAGTEPIAVEAACVRDATADGSGWLADGCKTLRYASMAAGRYSCCERPRLTALSPASSPPEDPSSLSDEPSVDPAVRRARRRADREGNGYRDAGVLKGDCNPGLFVAAAAAVAIGDTGSMSSESDRHGSEEGSDTVRLAIDDADVLPDSVRMTRPPPGVVGSLLSPYGSPGPLNMAGRHPRASSRAPAFSHADDLPSTQRSSPGPQLMCVSIKYLAR